MLAICGGTVMPITSKPIEGGVILVDDGKIKKVGKRLSIPKKAEVIDARDRFILPGLIDAHTHVGIFGEGTGYYNDIDGNEMTDPTTPHVRAIDSFNPQDIALPELLKSGVTAVLTGPGSGNVIGGQSMVVKTVGATVDDMVVSFPAGMKMALGQNPKNVYGPQKKFPSTRMGNAAILRETLTKAQNYIRKWNDYEKAKKKKKGKDEPKAPDRDIKMEALAMVLKGKLMARIHCHRADDLLTAVRIAEEFKIKISLEHATEAYKIVDVLAKKNVPCVVGPTLIDRWKDELGGLNVKNPGILEKAGIKVALQTDGAFSVQFLNVNAAVAVREGMSEEGALRAITINAAEIAGVADRLGSLEPGKDADIVIFSAHPFDVKAAKPVKVLVDGKVVYEQ
ncbi:amidohydrolase [Acidobacteriota bacterium]